MSGLNEAFEGLRNAIKNLNVYRSAYKKPNVGTIEDKFGTFTVKANGTSCQYEKEATQENCYVIRENAQTATVDFLPFNAKYINLRNSDNNTVIMSNLGRVSSTSVVGSSQGYIFGVILAPVTLILPTYFYGQLNFVVNKNTDFVRGLYLNTYGNNILGFKSWILNTNGEDSAWNYSVIDFDKGYFQSPMYLNRLKLSSKTFANLANKLGTVSNGKLYLGEKNIANLTAAQKSAIEAKGWTIL